MSKSKFEQLVEILSNDYDSTAKYLKRNSSFIESFTKKLSDYLECDINNLYFYAPEREKEKVPVQNDYQDLLKVMVDFSFEFRLLIKIKNERFVSHDCGLSFVENNLIPPSQVVLLMSINQEKENSFRVTAPDLDDKGQVIAKIFYINPILDDSWTELLESCFKVIKKTIEGGLEKRIIELRTKSDNTHKQAFGLI
jgi:hypothetical protein